MLGTALMLPPPPPAEHSGGGPGTGPTTGPGAGRGFGGGRGFGPPVPTVQTIFDVPAWVKARTDIREFGWLAPERDQTSSRKISFGYNVTGDLYYPTNSPPDKKLPVVIWLHGHSYPLGYMWVYRVDLHPILALVKAGYAVLAFDQSGFGSRMSEAAPFYDRFPHWSVMGRMVEDTRAAVDALQKDGQIRSGKGYLFGYSMGEVDRQLHTAATGAARERASFRSMEFTPMRMDTVDKGTGGIARLSALRGLEPKLGFFVGHESQIPYDFHELIATIAPRPVYVLQAQMDREATSSDVHSAVEQARKIYSLYNASNNLVLDEPWDYGRLPTATQDRIIKWMTENLK